VSPLPRRSWAPRRSLLERRRSGLGPALSMVRATLCTPPTPGPTERAHNSRCLVSIERPCGSSDKIGRERCACAMRGAALVHQARVEERAS
jgi:hypothetical protein